MRLRHYLGLRAKGLRRSAAMACSGWDITGVLKVIEQTCVWLVAVVAFLAFLSWLDQRNEKKTMALKEDVAQLSAIVQKCLGDREGALMIGGELYLCRAIPTGVK